MLAVLYLICTMSEWILHRYVMHAKVDLPWIRTFHDSHVIHHSLIEKDMTVREHERMYEDICMQPFSWLVILLMSGGLMWVLFGRWFSASVIIAHVLVFVLIEVVVWNSLHPYIHHVAGKAGCRLSSTDIPSGNPYVKWVVRNHAAHHLIKGERKGNFNIVFPGADYLMGTYREVSRPSD